MKTSQHSKTILLLSAVLPFATACRNEAAPLSSYFACTSFFSITGKGAASFSDKDSIDVFLYDNNGAQRLDSYQRLPAWDSLLQVQSTAGDKIAVLIQGVEAGYYTYNDILSFEGIRTLSYNLSDEDPSKPVLSAVTSISAGPGHIFTTEMVPLLAQVRIRSLKTDFSLRPYKNSRLEDVRAYLINVSGICNLIPQEEARPREIYNYGREDPPGGRKLKHPEMLAADVPENSPMYCYPCCGDEGELGGCTTRLVVEGRLDGTTYYYPINVGDGKVEAGHRYVYDITITRTGTLDPDIPADDTMLEVHFETAPWEEYENETLYY